MNSLATIALQLVVSASIAGLAGAALYIFADFATKGVVA